MDKILITIILTTGVIFLGLFAMWGGFAAPSLYLAMNIGIFSLAASVPLSIFLVMNNVFWGAVRRDGQQSHSYNRHVTSRELSQPEANGMDKPKPYLFSRQLQHSPHPKLGKADSQKKTRSRPW